MTNQETKVANWFSTELSSSVSNSTLTFPVDSIGSLTSPAYIIIDPDNAAKREVVLADGTWGASSFVASSIADRGLAGSASGAQAHDSGTVVEVRPLAQHIEDINDRVDGHAHGGGSDGTAVATGDLTGHTKAAHDALNIDADTLDGLDSLDLMLASGTRHDLTARHPISVLGDGSGLGLRQVVTFTSNGTFDKADYPWLRHVRVRAWGAGGGSGGCGITAAGESASSAAGGGGGYCEELLAVADLGTSETVTVGAAGAAGGSGFLSGGAGGATSFGALLSANGGNGGGGGSPSAATIRAVGGDGGTASGGDVNIAGSDGGFGQVAAGSYLMSAVGGASPLGGSVIPGNNAQGSPGVFPGGGASGTTSAASTAARAGRAGAAGLVVVELYA